MSSRLPRHALRSLSTSSTSSPQLGTSSAAQPLPDYKTDVFQQIYTSPFHPSPTRPFKNGGFHLLPPQRSIQPGMSYTTAFGKPSDTMRVSKIETLLPRMQTAWLHVNERMPAAPWQSDAMMTIAVDDEIAKMHFIVSNLTPGWHEVTIEFDRDVGVNGLLSLWKGEEAVRGPLCDSRGPVGGLENWAGIVGVPNKRKAEGETDFFGAYRLKAYALLNKIANRDKSRTEPIMARDFEPVGPPSTEDWDAKLLQRYLSRLPSSIKDRILSFTSPVTRAGLLLHIPALYSATSLREPPFNIVSTLKPGQSTVRLLPPTESPSARHGLAIHWVAADHLVARSFLARASNPDLHQRLLTIEYGFIPPARFAGRFARGATARAKSYGIMLTYARTILLRKLVPSATTKRGLARWMTWRHQIAPTIFPGVASIIEADRDIPPPARGSPRTVQKMDVSALSVLNRAERDRVPWEQREFPSIMEEPISELVAIPEIISGPRVYPEEVPMLMALREGRLPARGTLPNHLFDSLKAIEDQERRAKACHFLLDFFLTRHMTRRRKGEEVWRALGTWSGLAHLRYAPFQHNVFPLHLNFIEELDDLRELTAWVSLDRITLDLAVATAGPDWHYEHVRLSLPLSNDWAPPIGPLEGCRIELGKGRTRTLSKLELLHEHISITRWQREWQKEDRGWYHPLDRLLREFRGR